MCSHAFVEMEMLKKELNLLSQNISFRQNPLKSVLAKSWMTWQQVSLTSKQFAAINGKLFLGQISIIFISFFDKHKITEPFKVEKIKWKLFLLTFWRWIRRKRPRVLEQGRYHQSGTRYGEFKNSWNRPNWCSMN